MNKRMLAGVAGVVLLVGEGVGLGVMNNRAANNQTATSQTETSQPASSTPTPAPTPSVVMYDGVAGKTALELLKAKDPQAVTKGEGANAFVTTINGYTASEAKKEFWAFYINGQSSTVGAGSYTTKPGDKIEWKIETY